jgi:hypothetical protein
MAKGSAQPGAFFCIITRWGQAQKQFLDCFQAVRTLRKFIGGRSHDPQLIMWHNDLRRPLAVLQASTDAFI